MYSDGEDEVSNEMYEVLLHWREFQDLANHDEYISIVSALQFNVDFRACEEKWCKDSEGVIPLPYSSSHIPIYGSIYVFSNQTGRYERRFI